VLCTYARGKLARIDDLVCDSDSSGDAPAARALFLHVGLQNGVLIRTEVDQVTGRLSEQRMRFLGTRRPNLLRVATAGTPSMLALSSRPWLGHLLHGKFQLTPLAYEALDYVAPFASEKVPEGLVAIVRNNVGTGTLRVLTIDRLGEPFTQNVLKLAYTPRKLLVDEARRSLITIESDLGVVPYPHRTDLQVYSHQLPSLSHLCILK
jgi:splicing factor 3B subunit 3